jgi:uncharacterized membrane protein YjgN (DUF898 family)
MEPQDDLSGVPGQPHSAFGFYGRWQDYAPIAFTNLLLTIVTLGFYRFWATTRTRQYLWSQTRFIDERLEWTGTGKELFIGFLMVLLALGLPFLVLQFGVQALIFQGYGGIAGAVGIVAFALIFYLGGVALFRALRYRLSRTFWHGIRGGTDDQGWGYGFSSMWKSVVGSLVLGLLVPWAMMSLWNERWSKMSFGPFRFAASGRWEDTFKRWLLIYASIIGIFILVLGGIGLAMAGMMSGGDEIDSKGAAAAGIGVLAVLLIYPLIGLVYLAFYAKFFRIAAGGLSLATLDFQFTARSKHWLKLILGDVLLIIVTLGIGAIFLDYRHWKFFITHMEATGEISLSDLTQSATREPGQGEGLLDAFDMGAI